MGVPLTLYVTSQTAAASIVIVGASSPLGDAISTWGVKYVVGVDEGSIAVLFALSFAAMAIVIVGLLIAISPITVVVGRLSDWSRRRVGWTGGSHGRIRWSGVATGESVGPGVATGGLVGPGVATGGSVGPGVATGGFVGPGVVTGGLGAPVLGLPP